MIAVSCPDRLNTSSKKKKDFPSQLMFKKKKKHIKQSGVRDIGRVLPLPWLQSLAPYTAKRNISWL